MAPAEPEAGARARLIFAGVLACGLVSAILVVALARGGDPPPDPADPACVAAWNDDPQAVALGRHQFGVHRYQRVQVVRLGPSGNPDASGDCGVVFAASSLDAELTAAAQIEDGARWRALSVQPGISPERLEELQRDAAGLANAEVGPDGKLEADD